MKPTWTEQRLSNWFVSALADQLGAVLSKRPARNASTGAALSATEPHPEVWKAWTDPVWYSVQADVKKRAALFIGCGRDTALQLGGAESGDESGAAAALASFEEILNATLTVLDIAVQQQTGKSALFSTVQPADHPGFAGLGVEYRFQLGEATHLLAVAPSPALLEAVLLAKTSSAEDLPFEQSGVTGFAASAAERDLTPAASENLRMLMDVDLDLSVSFGKTRLLLQDVLKLASGSIVELNRSANDPVDLLVNNNIVARGEVVVVDGNYGVRVTEVVSQNARIRSVL